ncbi:MAG: glycoside hydrolase family 125 protein [Chitinophagales bacterium]
MKRKHFIYTGSLAAFSFLPFSSWALPTGNKRPPLAQRKFTSKAIEAVIEEIKQNVSDKELAALFENCFPNTLDTTVDFTVKDGIPDTYVITGDIDAMWLRDSSAQVNPYLPYCKEDEQLSLLIEGLIRRHTRCIMLDPYANAFYKDESKISQWKHDKTEMKPGVHERKYELDSLCYPIRLAHGYWKATGNTKPFTAEWLQAMQLAVATMRQQQRKNDKGPYRFQRIGGAKTDTLINDGYGAEIKPTGMICSAFRNSDDACTYLFNIPENLFAVVALRYLAEMVAAMHSAEAEFIKECLALADEVEKAVQQHGVIEHGKFNRMYVYECDGIGNSLLMDDAGIPSLISIPYLGYGSTHDELYLNSRAFALSPANPYFYKSEMFNGTGSPHLAWKHAEMIWPLGLIMRGLTAGHDDEIKQCLKMLKDCHAGTGFMHEGFNKNNAADFTRAWFAWANTLFGELILDIYHKNRSLLQE